MNCFSNNDLLEIFIALTVLSKHSDSNRSLSECCVLRVIGIIKQLFLGNDTVSYSGILITESKRKIWQLKTKIIFKQGNKKKRSLT